MRSQAFVYPWDVIGDPEAAERIAGLGVDGVTLASSYHSTRALTPRHPRHRIVVAEHAAVYYPVEEARWRGRALRPYPAGEWAGSGGPDAFGAAAEALRGAGLDVHAWVVLAHNSRLGAEHPSSVVRNAYGDRYGWAPCIGRPEVREYLVDLAAEAAARPGATGVELESCGWYGLAHLHAHDKIGGVPLDGAAAYAMSLCFCESCGAGYAVLGAEPAALARRVRDALAVVWSGEWRAGGDGEWADVERLLGAGDAELTLRHRLEVARELQSAAVSAVRAATPGGFAVRLHADPLPWRTGANAGVEPEWLLSAEGGGADGLVLPCAGGLEALTGAAAKAPEGASLAANFTVVRGMGGAPERLAADLRAAQAAGATELRLYHAGLAGEADLALVREALQAGSDSASDSGSAPGR
ncbi:hypothetical protein [Phaeacidiphilus oryzae]|uniref:hypothetical protein n=1 Tax=Phaeacidiphilus oryzae TaxID=348818 RepID=UPI00068BA02C|nr:hypothetical protein [Phaeacidiphilus oryzae]